MASRRKGPIRQLSLQLNSPPSRPTLKKQSSVTNDLSSKVVVKRPIRLAWADGENSVEIVAKRCTEQQKSNPTNPTQSIRHSFAEKETILYTRQELAERLRKAWKEREENKKGIDIFLAQNTILSDSNTYGEELTDRSNQSENSAFRSTEICDNETSFSKPVMPNEFYLNTFTHNNSETEEDHKLCSYVPSNTKTSISRDMAQISIIIANKTIKETKEIKSNAQNDCQITDENQNSTWSVLTDHSHPTDEEFNHNEKQTNFKESDEQNENDLGTEKQSSVVNPSNVKSSINKELNCDTVDPELTTSNTEKHSNEKSSLGCNNVIITPLSASAKRERFQRSATNKEFSGTVTDKPLNRPPLIRASSVPLNENKNKVVAPKRRLKTAPSTRRRVSDDRPPSNRDKNGKKNTKKDDKRNGQMTRSVSAAGGDIVTMVSLTSPAQSDVEDEDNKKTVGTKNKTPNEITEPLKMSSLRKTIKSVSFHQSTLSGARSYSASFPLRRVSLAPPSFASINALFASYSSHPQQSTSDQLPVKIAAAPLTEKLSENVAATTYHDVKTNNNTNSGTDQNTVVQQQETRGLKRRLVRMKSAQSFENLVVDPLTSIDRSNSQELQATGNATEVKKQFPTDDNMQCQENVPPTTEESNSEEAGNAAPKFNSSKEKQCWNMYKKMCEKGVTVSFDTILKGMLTPTEYRLRSKDLQTMITSENDDTS